MPGKLFRKTIKRKRDKVKKSAGSGGGQGEADEKKSALKSAQSKEREGNVGSHRTSKLIEAQLQNGRVN